MNEQDISFWHYVFKYLDVFVMHNWQLYIQTDAQVTV